MKVKEIQDILHLTLENGEKIEVFSETGEHFLVICVDNKIVIEKVEKK